MKISDVGSTPKLPTLSQYVKSLTSRKPLEQTFIVETFWKPQSYGYYTFQTHAFRFHIYESSPIYQDVLEYVLAKIQDQKPIGIKIDPESEEIEIVDSKKKGSWNPLGDKGFKFN